MFDYEKQPFYYSGKYGIRPLDNEGLSKYLYSKDSYTQTYLDPFLPVTNPCKSELEKELERKEKIAIKITNTNVNERKNESEVRSKSTPVVKDKVKATKIKMKPLRRKFHINNNKSSVIPVNRDIPPTKSRNPPKRNLFLQSTVTNNDSLHQSKLNHKIGHLRYFSTEIPQDEKPLLSHRQITESNVLLSQRKRPIIIKKDQKVLNQTQKKQLKLPDIMKMVKSPTCTIRSINSYSKYMGEKYDPNSLVFTHKAHVGRNFVGAKYEY